MTPTIPTLARKRPLLLDLFCGGGGASMGYYRAGFDVVGIDLHRQKNYPFGFIQADVMAWLPAAIESGEIERFDVIHASPPCQKYSRTRNIHHMRNYTYADLVEPVRELLKETGKPYVIENVPEAPLYNPLTLCGSMFGLPLIRHRLFESSPEIWFPPAPCICSGFYTNSKSAYSSFANGATAITVGGNNYPLRDGIVAMEINWMSKKELSQAIPPAYTQYIGTRMLKAMEALT